MNDYPVLLTCREPNIAAGLRRRLDPAKFWCVGPGESLIGRRFSAALVTVPDFHGSQAAGTAFAEWIHASVRCRLAPGCEDQLFYL